MLYQLPNGKTVQLSVEAFLSLSDAEINSLTGYEYGREINNPFSSSSINKEEDCEECDVFVEDDTIDEMIDDSLDIDTSLTSEE